jgi:hypothetical protein
MEPRTQLNGDLDTALRKWNAIATASFPDLTDSLSDAREALAELLRAIEERRVLSQTIVTQRGALEGLGRLPESLAAFHIELRTLAVQANRALRSGEAVANQLAALQGNGVELREVEVNEPPEHAGNTELVDALRERIAELERELALARESAAKAAESAAPRALPAEVDTLARLDDEPFVEPAPLTLQDELVRLRQEVEELKEANEPEQLPIGPIDTRIRGEAFDDSGKRRPMGLILLKAGLITSEQLEMALTHQRSAWNRHLGSILVELGFVEDEAVARAIAAQTRVEFVRLTEERPQMDAVRLISRKLAEHHKAIPVKINFNELVVAMANPLDLVALEDLKLASGRPIQPVVATTRDIDNAISRYYGTIS